MPTIFPAVAARNDQTRTRNKMAQIDSIEECQCNAYHTIENTSANARKRAPIAQPQLSTSFCWVILAGNPKRFARKFSIRVRFVSIRRIQILVSGAMLQKIPPVCQDNSPQIQITDSSSMKALSFSSARTMKR